MKSYVNTSGYCFTPIESPEDLRSRLMEICSPDQIRGTVIFSSEGFNAGFAGEPEEVERIEGWLEDHTQFGKLRWKHSFSSTIPFRRLFIKVKKQLVPLEASVTVGTAPYLPPEKFAKWLSEDRPMTILDTRNIFEFSLGHFEGAQHLAIENFREFKEAAEKIRAAQPNHPIVTYCTGGIRCEKAAPLLAQMGIENVYQLEGGILDYFETQGAQHFDGECFVFDDRVALDGSLSPTGRTLDQVPDHP